jgi:hypothetical protein
LNDLEDSNVSLDQYDDFEKPNEWSDDEWDTIMGIMDYAKRQLRKRGDSFNHDTMLRTVKEWSHFEELKNEINSFAKNEKQKTLRNLLNLIATDYLGFIRQLKKDNDLVDGDLASINKEKQNVEKKRQGYNILAQKADNLIKIDRINAEFDFIEKELRAFEGLKSIDSVRTSVTNLFDSVQKKEKEVFEKIIKEFSDFFKDFDSNDIVLESIDFYAIESDAGNFDKDKYIIEPARTKTHWCSPDEYIPAKYDQKKIEEEKIRNFKALALKRARSQRDQLLSQIREKVDNMRNQIIDELDLKIKEERSRLEGLKSQLDRKEEFKAENDAFIAKSQAAYKELIKLAQEYGYEF